MRSLFTAVLAGLSLAGGASFAEAATGNKMHAAGAYEGESRPHLLPRGMFYYGGEVQPSRRWRVDGGTWKHPRYTAHSYYRSATRASRHAAVRTVGGSGTTGMASYYGGRFHGHRTASGARFDSGALTAAHRSLPFGTLVRVTHLGNGRSVVVRINDRGPFVGGRVIDLSSGAAGVLGMHGQGVARVRISVVGR